MVLGIDDLSHFMPIVSSRSRFGHDSKSVNNPPFHELQTGKLLPHTSHQAQFSTADSSTIKRIDRLLQQSLLGGHSLSFLTDKHTGDIVVIVKDQATGEVLKEIPNQEIRDLAQSLLQLQKDNQIQSGLLLNIEV